MNRVLESLKKAGLFIKEKWTALDRKIRIGIIAGASVLIVSLIVLIIIMSQTGYAVLFSNASDAEAQEILSVIQSDLGISEVKITSSGDILVPQEQVESIRVQLSVLGYPKSAFNYNIFDSGVTMFSTATTIRAKQIQQLQQNLMATLDSIPGIDYSYVILNIPPDNNYVLTESKEEASASVMLHLKEQLTSESIDGIYNIVKTAVPGLTEENITVTDGDGVRLYADAPNSNSAADEIALYYKRFNFETQVQDILKENLASILDGVFSDYRVVVNVALNYDKEVSSVTEYTPSVDSEGTSGGMIEDEEYTSAGGGQAAVGGEVGTTVDADISPDYPTIIADENGDIYWETTKKIHRLVNEATKQIEKDGYSYDNLSASVIVDSSAMTTAELETWQQIVANAIGGDVIKVSFYAQPFEVDSTRTDSDSGTLVVNNNRSMLIFFIIGLGVLLLVLLFLALMAANSSKKRVKARQLAAASAAAGGMQGGRFDIGGSMDIDDGGAMDYDNRKSYGEGGSEFDLPSLTDQDTSNSREVVLKREIRDFSKTNPEIVAQLIRTWMRGDES